MKILAIGNSFSEDATRYLYKIARAQGVDLQVANLYIGGCSLERHYGNMLENKKDYVLQHNGYHTGFPTSIGDALLSHQWDVITLQQVSQLSFNKASYYPYVTELVKYIRAHQPDAKLYLQETWAYEDGSDRLLDMAKYQTSKAMLTDIQSAYSDVAHDEGFDGIIRSGTLFGMMIDRGIDKIHRDTYHATLGLGRYALGLLWFSTLTGKGIMDNPTIHLDEPATDEELLIARECVEAVVNL